MTDRWADRVGMPTQPVRVNQTVDVPGADPLLTEEDRAALETAYALGSKDAVMRLITAWQVQRDFVYRHVSLKNLQTAGGLRIGWTIVADGPCARAHILHEEYAKRGRIRCDCHEERPEGQGRNWCSSGYAVPRAENPVAPRGEND